MVFPQSVLVVADNSGAHLVRCIRVLNGSKRKKYASIGNLVICSVLRVKQASKVARHSVIHALVLSTKACITRTDGSVLSFGSNTAVLLNKDGSPKGTRVFGFVPIELRSSKCLRILSVAGSFL